MNILFFLKPKSTVAYLEEEDTLRQALEKMEHHHYSAIPVLTKEGKYSFTISEGDLLWFIKERGEFNLLDSSKVYIKDIKRFRETKVITVNNQIEELIELTENQNYVPVLDDREIFIGIVTRRDIIKYFYEKNGIVGR